MRGWAARHPFFLVTVPSVIALVAGLLLGRLVVSPGQAAVDATAPPPTTLTSPVVRGALRESTALDATVEPGRSVTVTPAQPPDGAKAVVSALHVAPGGQVKEGQAIVDISGRPTFVLSGAMAAYRTLVPGSSGPDVAQLQESLRKVGYEIDKSETTLGPDTQAAVTAFYTDRGYPAIVAGEEELKAARAGHVQAVRAEEAAERALTRTRRDRRQTKLAPPAGTDKTTPSKTGQSAKEPTEEQAGTQSQDDAVDDAELAVEYARQDTEAAEEELATARQKAGPQVPLGEVVFVPSLPATVSAVGLSAGQTVTDSSTVTLTSGTLVVRGKLTVPQAQQIKPKLSAVITTKDGQRLAGTVAAVRTVTDEEGQSVSVAEVTPQKPLAAALAGQVVRLSVRLSESKSEALLVPEAAVVTAADGGTSVRVDEGADSYRDVEVTVGGSGDGQVAVTPVGGKLAEGDSVVIGSQG